MADLQTGLQLLLGSFSTLARELSGEIRMMASLQQANIMPLLSAGRTESLAYYTMPWVEGHSLRHVMHEQPQLPVAYGVNILRDVALALVYAHSPGIVHGDIKRDNILLSGDTDVVADLYEAVTIYFVVSVAEDDRTR